MQNTIDTFFTSTPSSSSKPSSSSSTKLDLRKFSSTTTHPNPPIHTSQPITDRGSTFLATIHKCTSPSEARATQSWVKRCGHLQTTNSKEVELRQRLGKASHDIAAWRCLLPSPNSTTTTDNEIPFVLSESHLDDGETHAGQHVLSTLRTHALSDTLIIVSRWFGGTLLGPARFTHIKACAEEVAKLYAEDEERRDLVKTLGLLDEELGCLREELRKTTEGEATLGKRKRQDDDNLSTIDLTKARRLVQARERSIKSVRALLNANKQSQSQNSSTVT